MAFRVDFCFYANVHCSLQRLPTRDNMSCPAQGPISHNCGDVDPTELSSVQASARSEWNDDRADKKRLDSTKLSIDPTSIASAWAMTMSSSKASESSSL